MFGRDSFRVDWRREARSLALHSPLRLSRVLDFIVLPFLRGRQRIITTFLARTCAKYNVDRFVFELFCWKWYFVNVVY